MDHEILEQADQYFRARTGVSLRDLLVPIDGTEPAGSDLNGERLYLRIRDLRNADEEPAGAGEGSRDDWTSISSTIIEALTSRSKDLRLAAWLLEARVRIDGLPALAAGSVLLAMLCDHYWETIHPRMVDGDAAYRTNVFHWLDREIATLLRLEPLTGTPGHEPVHALADWERAVRRERSQTPGIEQADDGAGPDTGAIAAAFAATPHDALEHRLVLADHGRRGLQWLASTLGTLCGNATPDFSNLAEVIGEVSALLGSELERRAHSAPAAASSGDGGSAPGGDPQSGVDPRISEAVRLPDAIRTRSDAYACMAVAARFLARAEPHSPIPYVINRAVQWGQLDAAELYRELFLHNGGQLNVFEIMGLSGPGETAEG